MDNPIIIEAKKRVFVEAVKDTCDALHLPMPEINFSGDDDSGGDELAHSHPESYKICISERQLKLQDTEGLKETANHEMTHLIGMIQHGHQFEKVKRELMQKGWKPPKGSGVQFITGDIVNEQSRKIRENPERNAEVNEDSDFVKFLEGRESNKNAFREEAYGKKAEAKDRIITNRNQKLGKKSAGKGKKNSNNANYHKMTEAEIEEARKKLGIKSEKPLPNHSLHEKEKIEVRSKDEVWKTRNRMINIHNPIFEEVPAKYVKGIVTQFGTLQPSEFYSTLKSKYTWMFS